MDGFGGFVGFQQNRKYVMVLHISKRCFSSEHGQHFKSMDGSGGFDGLFTTYGWVWCVCVLRNFYDFL